MGTGVYGSYLMMVVIIFCMDKMVLLRWAWERAALRPVEPPPCWFSWYLLGAWPVVAVIGILTQCSLTGRGVHHDGKFKPLRVRVDVDK